MSARHLRIFVLIDALGWRCLEGREFLGEFLTYRRALRTILGFSSGAIPTLLTGRLPQEHGHWNLIYYDPQESPFRWLHRWHFVPDAFLNHRVTRKLLKELGRHLLGLGPLFECCVRPRLLPWFNWVERRNIYAPGGVANAPSIFDRLVEENVPYRAYSYHDASDGQILRRARRDLERSEASFFFLYLSELDGFLHAHQGDDAAVDDRLDWYATHLRELFRVARRVDPEAHVTVVSDHGMAPVKRHVDLVAEIDALGFRMPDDFLAVYDSTMARFWFFAERARTGIRATLDRLSCGRVLSDAELKELGVWFPDHRFGELVFLLHPSWLVGRSDFNGAGWMPVGMHGYHPDDPDSDAIFLSDRVPAIEPKSILDVYRCMEPPAR